ncbi:InlB B-repeat-containing protein, partial [Lachnoclostridium pacaense]|uniref:InlB B-repeat-containing protein n=1 Tax=Enterocloster hominis (ex Hitch et al. 2024) TaxID=1917870 RepID=UPI001D1127F1
MEGRKRSRALSRTVYSVQKRLLAFVLAAAMILTNVGADLNTALAATSSESVTFSMSGSQLVKAIDEAIANGNEVTAEDLDFTNGKIAEFEKLFFGEGKIYEAFPDPDGGSMDAELRVFVRLPEDADDMYMVTGDEEIIFLYVNNGEDSISCTTEITRMDDGAEKVKKTKRVTVKSYEAAYGDEEVNLISKPVETPAPLPEDTNGPGADETTAPAETESQVETTAPSVDGTTAAPDDATDETTTAPDETTAADETQATLPDETTAAPEESQTEEPATTEAAEEKTQEATEPEKTEAPETEAPEAGEPVASIIRHNAPLVADNENGDAAGTKEEAEAKEETEAPEPEKEEAPKETEAPTKEEATTAEETEATEAPTKEESTEATDSTDPTEPAQDATDETTTAADGETTVPGTDETTAAPVESGSSSADESETKAPAQTVPDVASPSEAKPTEAPAKDDNVSAAGTSDLVGIGYCSTAKVYVTTINQLKALDDFGGYKISYAIYPEASARIVEGPRGVEEGQALSFGVKNQIGYAVESVTANGEILSVDSITDNDDGSQTAWYSVPEIYEEQEVEVYMTETGEHPEFSAELPMEDGTIISLYAPEGVLPANTKAVASVVTGIEDVVKESVEAQAAAEGETKEVITSLSYNIDLLDVSGTKLDDEIWSGAVQVTFTGAPIEKNSKEADSVEVLYVATTKEDEPQADVSSHDVISVEAVADAVDVSGEQSISEIAFEAEHFSVYTVTFTNSSGNSENIINFVPFNEATGREIYPDGLDKNNSYKLSFGIVGESTSKSVSDISKDMAKALGINQTGYKFEKAVLSTNANIEVTHIGYTREYKRGWKYNFVYSSNGGSTWNDLKSGTTVKMLFSEEKLTVTFNANNGSGEAPAALKVSPNSSIVLPGQGSLMKNQYRFLGWSLSSDSSKIESGVDGVNKLAPEVIKPGEYFGVGKDNVTLYAVWAQDSGSKYSKFKIAVFTDGTVYAEPSIHSGEHITVYDSSPDSVNILKYIRYAHTTTGIDDVSNNLTNNFYQLVEQQNNKYRWWDSETQYIEWYVIKDQRGTGTDNTWHIDGALRNYESVYLTYDRNGAQGKEPDSQQEIVGGSVFVQGQNTMYRSGYEFVGWNTERDGSGISYSPGDRIKLTNNMILYAQWNPKNSVEIKYAVVGIIGSGTVGPQNEWLNPDIGVSNGSTAKANYGYRFVGWYSDKSCEEKYKLSSDLLYKPIRPENGWKNGTTFYAKFEKDLSQWVTITFDKGLHGELEGVLTQEVLKGTDFSEIRVPTIKAAFGYQVAEQPWSPKLPGGTTAITSNATYTAQYGENAEDWATVTFLAGEHGSLEGSVSQKVLKGTEFSAIEVPAIKAAFGYKVAEQ